VDVPSPAELSSRFAALAPVRAALARLGDEFRPPVYLVGGVVRDLLLGGRPLDVDLVVEGPIDPVLERLGARGVVRSHDRFGTATVELEGHIYDIARSRRERYPEPGALPIVEPAALAEDLHRRDFSVNALAAALTGEKRGQLVAVELGLEDLDAGLLRVLHSNSFRDDPTRLLRLARYRSRLGFAEEPATARRARAAVDGRALDSVSGARIGHELRLLAREPDPMSAVAALREHGIDAAVEPGFGLGKAEVETAREAAALMGGENDPARLVLGLALHGVSGERRVELLDRLAFPTADRDVILAVAGEAGRLAEQLSVARSPSEIAAAAAGEAPETVAVAGALGAEAPAREWLERLRHVSLDIDGSDLLAEGILPGPAVGAGLRAARVARLDGRAPDRERQLAEALRAARSDG
jgi:tRNA nucleotidyltransferase (CCA-adding enzyme)